MESKGKGGTALYNTVVAEELGDYEGACAAFLKGVRGEQIR